MLGIKLYPASHMYKLTAINNSMNFNALISEAWLLHAFKVPNELGINYRNSIFLKSQLVRVRILAEEPMDTTPRELARGHTTGINCKFVYS